MGNVVMWALLTGGITGGVWVSIVLLGNHARLRMEQRQLGELIESRRAELALLAQRLEAMEARHAALEAGVIQGRRLDASPLDEQGLIATPPSPA